ncbi:MAG: DUF2284 domain-containing protein [Faecousia sp.]
MPRWKANLTQKTENNDWNHGTALDPSKLQPMAAVREMCAEDRCRAYRKNWTCPPHCGTPEECGERIHSFRSGMPTVRARTDLGTWRSRGGQARHPFQKRHKVSSVLPRS